MTADAYSPLKATRHLDIIGAVRRGEPARPAHVQLILSDLCNQACNFCAYRDPSYSSSQLFYEVKPGITGLRRDPAHMDRNYNPNRMIPHDKAIEILQDCFQMGVSGVQFTGGGEPTVHPQFYVILRAAHGYGLATSLVTNGVNVGKHFDDWEKALLQLAWIRFSLDAGTHDTYTKVRNVPPWHFDSAKAAIEKLRAARDKNGSGPVIGVGFVVTPENWEEVEAATSLVKSLGADNIRISAQFSTDDEKRFAAFHEACADDCRNAEECFTDEHFTVYNRFGEKLADLEQKAPDYDRCGYQQFTTYIGADLNVYRCCVLAYNPRGIVGSLKDQRFSDLWMSQERMDEMLAFDARGCERCQFNTINRNLSYMLQEDDPLHSEFV